MLQVYCECFVSQDYNFFVFTLEESKVELAECIRQTKRIKWNFSPLVKAIHLDLYPVVEHFLSDNHIKIECGIFDCVWLPREKAMAFNSE